MSVSERLSKREDTPIPAMNYARTKLSRSFFKQCDFSIPLFDDETLFVQSKLTSSVRVTIILKYLWIVSTNPVKHSFSLSYLNIPLGIDDNPFKCVARADPTIETGDRKKTCAVIYNGVCTKVVTKSDILRTQEYPKLTIQVRYAKEDYSCAFFAYINIPLKQIIKQMQLPGPDYSGEVTGHAELKKVKSDRQFGHMDYSVKVENILESSRTGTEGNQFKDDERIPHGIQGGSAVSESEVTKTINKLNQKLSDVELERNKKYLKQLVNKQTHRESIATINEEVDRLGKQREELIGVCSQAGVVINDINKKLEFLANHIQRF